VSLRVDLRPEAEADIEEAATWYEGQRETLGDEFLDEMLSVFGSISDNPRLFPIVHRDTHRALIHRFPFGIYYRIEEESIVVMAVMHGSRHPRRWQKRT
jgi:plasmid stabilization system protein ParE